MTTLAVCSQRAEESVRQINFTLAGHKQVEALLSVSFSASGRLSAGNTNHMQRERQATYLRLVSIAEHFCSSLLIDVVEEIVAPPNSGPLLSIWDDAADGAVGTWHEVEKKYKTWLDVKPDWVGIRGAAEVRNTIAHGLGNLTRRQLSRRQSVETKISQHAGVRIENDSVVLEIEDLERVRKICMDVVLEVDEAVTNSNVVVQQRTRT